MYVPMAVNGCSATAIMIVELAHMLCMSSYDIVSASVHFVIDAI